MPELYHLAISIAFSIEQKQYIEHTFSKLCKNVRNGNKTIFDKFCSNIYPFCNEVYEMGKNLQDKFEVLETPNDSLIFSIGANISVHILPIYKNYLAKSEGLYNMARDIINDEKFETGRVSFITEIWTKTRRTDEINIHELVKTPIVGGYTFAALLKLKNGNFVEDAHNYLKLFPNDWNKKKIELYIERYSANSNVLNNQ